MNPENNNLPNGSGKSNNLPDRNNQTQIPPLQTKQPRIDTASIYPTPVDTTHTFTPNTNDGPAGPIPTAPTNRRFLSIKTVVVIAVILLVGGGAVVYSQSSRTAKNQNDAKKIAGNYMPDFDVFAPSQLPDSNYYLEGIITPDTKPIGTPAGTTMLQYRSKNVPKNSDYTLDTSIVQIREEKKKNGYMPPTSCANLDTVPVNKTACEEVGKTSDNQPIYLWPSTAIPVLYVAKGETFISVSMPGNKAITTDELVKITASLKLVQYNDLLNQAHL